MIEASGPDAEVGLIDLNYAALDAAESATDPFPHIVVPGFVPAVDLPDITGGLPRFAKGGSFPIDSLVMGAPAKSVIAGLASERFRDAVARRFLLDLHDAPTMITLRGQSRAKDGRIHCDSVAKRVTVLLYLNPTAASWTAQEGCLRLLRSASDLDDYAVEIPPTAGTLLVFPNGPTTWHGHKPFIGQRYVIQLNYMANDEAARRELRRHRLSAMVKRLAPA